MNERIEIDFEEITDEALAEATGGCGWRRRGGCGWGGGGGWGGWGGGNQTTNVVVAGIPGANYGGYPAPMYGAGMYGAGAYGAIPGAPYGWGMGGFGW